MKEPDKILRGKIAYDAFHKAAETRKVRPFEDIEPHHQMAWVQAASAAAAFEAPEDRENLKMFRCGEHDYFVAEGLEEANEIFEQVYQCTPQEFLEGEGVEEDGGFVEMDPGKPFQINLIFPIFGLPPGEHVLAVKDWCRIIGKGHFTMGDD